VSTARRILAAALAGALALLGACARAPAPGPQPIVLRFASPYPPNHPFSQADIAWMRHVEGAAGGRLKIMPYWGGALVSSDNAILELAHGIADIALVTPIYSRAGARAIKVQAGFYSGAKTPAEQVAVYRCLQRQFPVLDQEMRGVRVLAIQGGNLPDVLTRGRPVTQLADFRGLRLRTPSEIAPLLRQLGADPVTMPMAEVYSSLSKGVVDGVVAPADTLRSLHFSEVAPNLSVWQVPRGAYPARAISVRAWAKLPPDLQRLLAQSQDVWEHELNARVMHAEAVGMAFGKAHGQRFVTPEADDVAAFQGLYDQAALHEARAASTPEFDGAAMFNAAHAAISRLQSGRPAC
jgi:TRAP-type C4-dicarboxylate transport system substrate-binding protein